MSKPYTKPIANFPGYEISPYGEVWSNKTNQIVQGNLNSMGYRRVGFYQNGKAHLMFIHRLVAATWLGEGQGVVNHIDGDPTNNCVSNLEWVSQSENLIHSFANLGHRLKSKLSASDLDLIRWLIKQGNSQTEVALLFSIAQSRVSQICSYLHLKQNKSGTNAWGETYDQVSKI